MGEGLEQFLLDKGMDLTTMAYAPLSGKTLNRIDLLLLSLRWGETADRDYAKQLNDRLRDVDVPVLYIIETRIGKRSPVF